MYVIFFHINKYCSSSCFGTSENSYTIRKLVKYISKSHYSRFITKTFLVLWESNVHVTF